MSDADQQTLKNEAVRALRRMVTPTYQQNEMIERNELSVIMNHVIARRRKGDWIYIGVSLLLLYVIVRAISNGQVPYFSGSFFAALVLNLRFRRNLEKEVRDAVFRFEQTLQTSDSPIDVLKSNLSLRYSLSFEQRKRIDNGEVLAVAGELIRERRSNARDIQLGLPLTGFLLPAMNLVEGLAAGEPIRMVQLAVLMTFAIALAVTGIVMSKKEHAAADVLEGQLRAASPSAW